MFQGTSVFWAEDFDIGDDLQKIAQIGHFVTVLLSSASCFEWRRAVAIAIANVTLSEMPETGLFWWVFSDSLRLSLTLRLRLSDMTLHALND